MLSIASVNEPKTHSYDIEVSSPYVCGVIQQPPLGSSKQPLSSSGSVLELLNSLSSKPCLLYVRLPVFTIHNAAHMLTGFSLNLCPLLCVQTTGWWSYEFCYAHKVRQFHQEIDEKGTRVSAGKLFAWTVHAEWCLYVWYRKNEYRYRGSSTGHL